MESFTVDNFKYPLHRKILSNLHKHSKDPEKDRPDLIELLRQLAEYLIYSEQHEVDFFKSFFKSFNTQSDLESILHSQPSKETIIQLLQTVTLFIHNISSEENKEYLLSSSFLSKLVSNAFDFSDEEIVESYLSFLKGFSVNLSKNQLVNFLLNQNFSLFFGAMMFFNYRESMIKTASRTVILNIIKLNNDTVNNYVLDSGFFFTLTNHLWKVIKGLDDIFRENVRGDHRWNELEDNLFYVNDIIEQETPEINEKLVDMIIRIVFPSVFAGFTGIRQSFHCETLTAMIIIAKICDVVKSDKIVEGILYLLLRKEAPEELVEIIRQPPPSSPPEKLSISYSKLVENDVYDYFKNRFDKPDETFFFLFALQGVIHNPSISKETLSEFGLLSSRLHRNHELVTKILQEDYHSSPPNIDILDSLFTMLEKSNPSSMQEYYLICHLITELLSPSLSILSSDYLQKLNEPLTVHTTDVCEILNELSYMKVAIFQFKTCYNQISNLNFFNKIPFPNFRSSRSSSLLSTISSGRKLSSDGLVSANDMQRKEKFEVCLLLAKLRHHLLNQALPPSPIVYKVPIQWNIGDFFNTENVKTFKAKLDKNTVLVPDDYVQLMILENNKDILPLAVIKAVHCWAEISLSYNLSDCSLIAAPKFSNKSYKLHLTSQAELQTLKDNFKQKVQIAVNQEIEMIRPFFRDIIENIFNNL